MTGLHSVMGAGAGARAAGLAAGVVVDHLLGDPRRAHPVAWFGRGVGGLERAVFAQSRLRGLGFVAVAVAGPLGVGVAAERLGRHRPVVRLLATAGATWVALGGTSLGREGLALAGHLDDEDLVAARRRLGHLCARDSSGLGPAEIARAGVESLAENASDAVVAPLFWGAVAGVPGLLVYRAVNTLDAMVGYRSERYARFGWAAARTDDLANLLPARITGALVVAAARSVAGSSRRSWRVMRRDARRHPSPNAGWCEAAAAGALGVRLGGLNVYHGQVEHRAPLGAEGRPVEVRDLRRAVRLGRAVAWSAAVLAVGLAAVLERPERER